VAYKGGFRALKGRVKEIINKGGGRILYRGVDQIAKGLFQGERGGK